MLVVQIFFAVIIIICAVFYVMYLWDFALVLLISVLIIPVVMLLTTYIAKKNISAEFALKNDTAAKNESFPVQIKLVNRSIFPIGKAEAHIEYCNIFNSESSSFILLMPIQARNEQSVSFQLSSKYCGIVTVRCKGISIYDPLRLFRFTVGKNIHTEIAVMPEGHEISGQVCFTDRVNEESSVFSEHKSGDDPSEVFDLRGYNPGDKINRIHWKLSSKKDDFIVKDYSLPVDIPCTLFLDLKCSVSSEFTLPVFDTLVETFVSVSRFMIENERIHTIIYYDGKAEAFIEKTISDYDSLTETVRELISSLNDNLLCGSPENYFMEKDNLSLSSFIFVTSSPEQSVMEFIDDNIDADIKNAIVVVTSPHEAEELSSNYSDISVIPVVIGRITSSIKDIEV